MTLGALICLADMTHVFFLNMTYDVPVKLLSFHCILLSLLLLAPHSRRLTNMFLLNRGTQPVLPSTLFRTVRANRIALAVQAFLWLWILGNTIYSVWYGWHQYGPGTPKSPLYGIWDVAQYSSDGQNRPPLLTDNKRWRRLMFDLPDYVSFQRMDDSIDRLDVVVDTKKNKIMLTNPKDKRWKADFSFTRPSAGQFNLEGVMDGHAVQLQLRLVDHTKFLFASRGFHWVQESPLNR